MQETNDHPLAGDVIVRPIRQRRGAPSPTSYVVSVFPLALPARRAFRDMGTAIEFACAAAEKNGGGIQVWCESEGRPGEYHRASAAKKEASRLK